MRKLIGVSLLAAVFLAVAPGISGAQEKKVSNVNQFNRLFKGAANYNLPPTKDGIHDPDNIGTEALQPPATAFETLADGRSGNRVDWVKALAQGEISPRADRLDGDKKMTVLDLNIVRQVKGSMPDVVYPHKQHTEWLDCRNCHPKIFIPKKGGNNISMAAILMGQYCGVCHGKVAFPVSECRFCHSKNKTKEQLAELRQNRRAPRTVTGGGNAPAATKAAATAPAPAADKKPAVQTAELAAPKEMSQKDLMDKGAAIYTDNCSGCHGENGEGVPGTFPALAGSKIATGNVEGHLAIVLDGKADTAMQAWRDSLSVEDIAAVITFERNSFGNKTGDLVQPKMVAAAMNRDLKAPAGGGPAAAAGPTDHDGLVKRGGEVYAENCSGCHGENGEGVPDTFPALKGSKVATGPAAKHIEIVVKGKPDTAMQAWADILSSSDLAAVITFERNAWGNNTGDTVQAADVDKAK